MANSIISCFMGYENIWDVVDDWEKPVRFLPLEQTFFGLLLQEEGGMCLKAKPCFFTKTCEWIIKKWLYSLDLASIQMSAHWAQWDKESILF